jgi:hypothetical protein
MASTVQSLAHDVPAPPGMTRPASAFGACRALLRRDFTLAWRRRGELFLPLLYAVIVAALFRLHSARTRSCWAGSRAAYGW